MLQMFFDLDHIIFVGQLKILQVSYNEGLGGTIPSTICGLKYLSELSLGYNSLTGRIPECIGNLTLMTNLEMASNGLTGTIPNSISKLTQLLYLVLEYNFLTGAIPSSIGKLTLLQELYIDTNMLNGSIPRSIGNLTLLHDLYLHHNQLTGGVPDMGNLTRLVTLDLSNNMLSGAVPSSLGQLAHLQELALCGNALTGTIPSSVTKLVQLHLLYLYDNALSGSIPSSIGRLIHMTELDVDTNMLTGAIPSSIGYLTRLIDLELFGNLLTGTIPSSIGNLTRLLDMDIYINYLTGAIPASIGELPRAAEIYLNDNLLTGSIPSTLRKLDQLLQIDLHNNMLTGVIPSLGNSSQLALLALQNNRLTGPLVGVFNATQSQLFLVALDNNQFTGELPPVVFELPALLSLSIVGSCLHGTLPPNVCNATALEALILYGLTTGASCRTQSAQLLTSSQPSFWGTIPTCLFSMPNLITLLLSSNSLSGTMVSDVRVSSQLRELDVSHNNLAGSIPASIQNHSWARLDLSHNKLRGVLDSDLLGAIGNYTSYAPSGNLSLATSYRIVSLSSNRLSGPVPSALMPLHNNLSVLAGNLFECKYDKSNLPQHDSDVSNYQCASNTFDIAIYVWFSLGLIAAMTLLVVGYRHHGLPTSIRCSLLWAIQLPDSCSARLTSLHVLLEQYYLLHKLAWYCAAFCVVVLLPYYSVVSHYAGTHTHQYAYVLSAIYVSGVTPFVCDVLLYAMLAAIACCGIWWNTVIGTALQVQRAGNHVRGRRALVWCVFAAANITIVLGANIAFVYVVLYQSSQLQTLAQILLSLFKLSWSTVAAPNLMRQLQNTLMKQENVAVEPFFTLQLLVSLFNNIAIPCLVVAAIDPNCFSNVLLSPPTENVQYPVPYCEVFSSNGTCTHIAVDVSNTEFTPPFTYSYQCSASFITSYAPAFIYMSMSTVFLSPLLQYVLLRLYERLPTGSIAHRLVAYYLPNILKLPVAPAEASTSSTGERRKRTIVGAVGTLVTLLTQLGILLTFGAIFPPVALAMAVSISAVVFLTRLKVLRFVHAAEESKLYSCLDSMNEECQMIGTGEQMRVAVVIIICYCCAFYTLFLFDTLGDAVGFDGSAWVLGVIPLMPCLIFSSVATYRKCSLYIRSVKLVVGAPEVELAAVTLSEQVEESGVEGGVVSVLHDVNVV